MSNSRKRQKADRYKRLLHPRIVIGVPSEITPVERRAVMEACAKASEVHLVQPESESKAFDLLAAGDVSAAVAAITPNVNTQAALEALGRLCNRAYRDLKSVPTMTAIAWEAIRFGLECAEASPDSESASR